MYTYVIPLLVTSRTTQHLHALFTIPGWVIRNMSSESKGMHITFIITETIFFNKHNNTLYNTNN